MNTITKLFVAFFALFYVNGLHAQNFIWGKAYGGEGEDVVRAMTVDGEGTTYLTGYFTDTSVFGSGAETTTFTSGGFYDVFVSKTSTTGNLLWVKAFGAAANEYGTAIATDAQGNVYVSGVFEESFDADPGTGVNILTTAGGLDIFVIKLNAEGNFVWAKSLGGEGYEETTAMGIDGAGNLYVAGYFYAAANFNNGGAGGELTPYGSSDGFIVKYAQDGTFTWAQQFGGTDIDLPVAMKVMNNGDLYLTGKFRETADFNPNPEASFTLSTEPDNSGVFVMHLNSAGYLQHAVNMGESPYEAISRDLDVDSQGNAYITGHYGGPMVFNPGGENEISLDSGEFTEGFIAKVNFTTGVTWAKAFECDAASFGLSVAVNSLSETFVSGFFAEAIVMGDIVLEQQSENADDNFLAKLDAQGNFVNAYAYGGANYLDSHHLKIDDANVLYIAGAFENSVDLNPLTGESLEVQSNGFRDTYIIKMDSNTLGVSNPDLKKITFYPNPVNDVAYIQSAENLTGTDFNVYEASGRGVIKGKIASGNTINLNTLSNGIYMVEVSNHAKFKIIKN